MEQKKPCTVGILAHVDAGKTTLSEALLYQSGARRTLGRVDRADAFLDTHVLERARGITIFSKQALLETPGRSITLIDTPGHVDFAAETERVLPVLDCAILVISATDGVQAHTVTLWKLLQRYGVPSFIFVSKCDLPGLSREALLQQLRSQLSSGCVDFTAPAEEVQEACAMCDEAALEEYLTTGTVEAGRIRSLIADRRLCPCCFGAGLRLQGVDTLLELLDRYAPLPVCEEAFGARVYKISRDASGNRLTWLRLTGGTLRVRQSICYTDAKGTPVEEKIVQLRRYSGEKFTAPELLTAGQVCAVTGLSATWAGQGLGSQTAPVRPLLEPVMTYRVALPGNCDPLTVLPKLRQLEEEDPQLHILWDERLRQVHVQLMGKVQLEVLRALISQRFGLDVTLTDRRIYYKETIAAPVEGVGHFEPLRHYAEVHLLLEPLPQGSGLVFDTQCPSDVLDMNYQKLILTHLAEKTHLGVLTGAPITDMKLTLLVGKAHLKHTEGGDFRQATYRAVRQGLMQAQSVLLEPWYRITLQLPTECVGRAITDIRAMSGRFELLEAYDGRSVLTGTVPAGELGDYAELLAAYTQGRGQLQVAMDGYAPCHDAQSVVAALDYDPEADIDNTPDSVFCAHGAGFNVKWDQVKSYMHLDSGVGKQPAQPAIISRPHIDDAELEAIMQRQFGPAKTRLWHKPEQQPATQEVTVRPPKDSCLIVDGYNIIFAWDDLAETARSDLDAARRRLCDMLSSYAGYKKCYLVLVFDGYRVKGSPGEKELFHNIHIVYTKEGETADAYIEALVGQIGKNYAVRVATSDALIQLTSLRSGVLRLSARELRWELDETSKQIQEHYGGKS